MIVDIESCSLSESKGIPIHIAWKDGKSICHGYINIFELNDDNYFWDKDSENIHGISRGFLKNYGISPVLMCEKLNEEFASKECVSDSLFDDIWLNNLFSLCNIRKRFNLIKKASLTSENSLNLIKHLAHHDVFLIKDQKKTLTAKFSL